MILKKNKVEEVTLQNLKTYYKATVIKTVCYWYKKKIHVDQPNCHSPTQGLL